MSKAILVIDMPKRCSNCELYHCGYKDVAYCAKARELLTEDDIWKERPSWCPLKPMPPRKTCLTLKGYPTYDDLHPLNRGYEKGFHEGWNACIDKILGGEE